jgi:hypothetical protein
MVGKVIEDSSVLQNIVFTTDVVVEWSALSFMKMTVFWDVAPCSLIEVYWCCRGACSHHNQGDGYSTNFYQTAWRNILEESHLHTCHCKNLKSHSCFKFGNSQVQFLKWKPPILTAAFYGFPQSLQANAGNYLETDHGHFLTVILPFDVIQLMQMRKN